MLVRERTDHFPEAGDCSPSILLCKLKSLEVVGSYMCLCSEKTRQQCPAHAPPQIMELFHRLYHPKWNLQAFDVMLRTLFALNNIPWGPRPGCGMPCSSNQDIAPSLCCNNLNQIYSWYSACQKPTGSCELSAQNHMHSALSRRIKNLSTTMIM